MEVVLEIAVVFLFDVVLVPLFVVVFVVLVNEVVLHLVVAMVGPVLLGGHALISKSKHFSHHQLLS